MVVVFARNLDTQGTRLLGLRFDVAAQAWKELWAYETDQAVLVSHGATYNNGPLFTYWLHGGTLIYLSNKGKYTELDMATGDELKACELYAKSASILDYMRPGMLWAGHRLVLANGLREIVLDGERAYLRPFIAEFR
ncbi:MAG: hypothetical protein KF690_06365 [Bacteroidetes bacterium]|nr:hypothetical protein [Bacteroidota bacterium]